MNPSSTDRADAYVRLWESLTPDNLNRLPELVTPDVRFADPFNDVRGMEALKRVMLKAIHDVPEQRFAVTRRAWDGDLCLLCWAFTGRTRGGQRLSIEGMSQITVSADGKVSRHIDHWDAGRQFYEKLPLIGAMLRLIRRRLAG